MVWESARDTLERFFALAVEEKIGVGDRHFFVYGEDQYAVTGAFWVQDALARQSEGALHVF